VSCISLKTWNIFSERSQDVTTGTRCEFLCTLVEITDKTAREVSPFHQTIMPSVRPVIENLLTNLSGTWSATVPLARSLSLCHLHVVCHCATYTRSATVPLACDLPLCLTFCLKRFILWKLVCLEMSSGRRDLKEKNSFNMKCALRGDMQWSFCRYVFWNFRNSTEISESAFLRHFFANVQVDSESTSVVTFLFPQDL